MEAEENQPAFSENQDPAFAFLARSTYRELGAVDANQVYLDNVDPGAVFIEPQVAGAVPPLPPAGGLNVGPRPSAAQGLPHLDNVDSGDVFIKPEGPGAAPPLPPAGGLNVGPPPPAAPGLTPAADVFHAHGAGAAPPKE
jgi:hypothetical protein